MTKPTKWHVPSKESDQLDSQLISVFIGRTGHFVGFVVRMLIVNFSSHILWKSWILAVFNCYLGAFHCRKQGTVCILSCPKKVFTENAPSSPIFESELTISNCKILPHFMTLAVKGGRLVKLKYLRMPPTYLIIYRFIHGKKLLTNLLYSRKLCLWWSILFSRCPSVRPSVTLWFFPNILKTHWWIFINFCRHIGINKVYLHKKRCTYIRIRNALKSMGWGKEVIRFWWPWSHF